ncbi:MAG: hypothetical protein JRG92_05915 [Deltaproteobacteria bacterium]|nr:hypothetical protein [Deltaproteobacteria bacterium]
MQGRNVGFKVWRWGSLRDSGERAGEPECRLPTPDLQCSLAGRGISPELSARLAEQLEPRFVQLDSPARLAMIDGVALALDLQRETTHDLARSLRGLKEVERMMGAFSGELSKLDEVLEVLAAYVRRMKTSGRTDESRTLH